MSQPTNDPIRQAVQTVEQDRAGQIDGLRRGLPSLFTCPECGGTLWQVDEPEMIQFRCHVGHILSGEMLLQEQTGAAENSLWYTIRTLTDKMVLARLLAEHMRKKGDEATATTLEARARQAEQKALALRRVAEDMD